MGKNNRNNSGLPELPFSIRRLDQFPEEWPHDLDPDKNWESLSQWKWWLTHLEHAHQIGGAKISKEEPQYVPNGCNSDDSLNIIGLFCNAHENGVYPSAQIMNELYSRFKTYIADNMSGKTRPLGRYFDEKITAGRRVDFKRLAHHDILEAACEMIYSLEQSLPRNISKGDIHAVVSLYLKDQQSYLPVGWTNSRPKGIESILKTYTEWKTSESGCHYKEWLNRLSLDEQDHNAILSLLRIGEKNLCGYPKLEEILKKALPSREKPS
ncbi:MAG: hypothetical protein C0622_07645 [Desulfuromonas sp.]|nr:MAG: hypothetical protein C0622_07645 [Desulfuromonas sp.]